MIVTTNAKSKNYNGNTYCDVWLNGGLIKLASYADNINGVVLHTKVKKGKIVNSLGRGKVKIVRKD